MSPPATLLLLGLLALLPGCAVPGAVTPGRPAGAEGWAAALDGTTLHEGLLRLHLDADGGRLLLELPAPDDGGQCLSLLWAASLRTGVGSNPLGLDRGLLGEARWLRWLRQGRRVLVEEPNLRFRAAADADRATRLATVESFAPSVLWGAEALALHEDGRALVDLTEFLVRDAPGVGRALETAGEGSFALDAGRSLLDARSLLVFPHNVEVDALLTFAGERPGPELAATVPEPGAVSVVAHHSFVRLPDDGYQPREHDPRAGAFSLVFQDTTAPLEAPLERTLATRHRLVQRGGRGTPVSAPIVYHVDRGAPPAVRQALLEGAGWWTRAFDAAGLPDAFRVELLPEGAHPLDVRFNVVQWVHRASRGWSQGRSLVDPRTGEILKGHVTLGALRVRHDRLLLEGLLGTQATGNGGPDDPVQLALARIRQLAAHEVGHALGLAHNFAGSQVFNGSVMDYPAPRLAVAQDGTLDASGAYGVGVGPWDLVAVRWLYGTPPAGLAPEDVLPAILAEVQAASDRPVPPFLSDEDARPAGAAEPRASLWDTDPDPLDSLSRALAVREAALARFDASRLAAGRPRAELAQVLAPLYLHHRYALAAVGKALGGVHYEHALVGDGRAPVRFVEGALQRRALAALLGALDPAVLDVPEPVLALLVPPPPGRPRGAEELGGDSAPVFDPLGAAATAALLVLDELFQPERCARLLDQARRDASLPSLTEVGQALLDATFPPAGARAPDDAGPRRAALRRVAQRVAVDALLERLQHARLAPGVRAAFELLLERVAQRAAAVVPPAGPDDDEGSLEQAHRSLLLADIARHRARVRLDEVPPSAAPPAPPGSPIGAGPWPAAASPSFPSLLSGCSLSP